jgi:phage shock protein A
MGILAKLHTLLRASARESAEQITEANAIRIYRQEIVDAQNFLAKRKTCLASLIATRKDLEQEISRTQRKIAMREAKISGLEPAQRSASLLQMTAQDIAANEIHTEKLKQQHVEVAERINNEELTLRNLRNEICEHRREVKLLQAQRNTAQLSHSCDYTKTVSAHLATLRDTRDSISAATASSDNAEAGMQEAIARVDGDSVEQALTQAGHDDKTHHINRVIERLKLAPHPAC